MLNNKKTKKEEAIKEKVKQTLEGMSIEELVDLDIRLDNLEQRVNNLLELSDLDKGIEIEKGDKNVRY